MAKLTLLKITLCFSSAVCFTLCGLAQSEKTPVVKSPSSNAEKRLSKEYQKWLDEDVRWIVRAEERDAMYLLGSGEEREQFVIQFWLRHDPTPDTKENEFREEHYRRLAYSNDHFAAKIAGGKTDRGGIYVLYGKPDEVISQSPDQGNHPAYPIEIWKYRSLAYGRGTDVELRFVDRCRCNDYELQPSGIPNLLDPPPIPLDER